MATALGPEHLIMAIVQRHRRIDDAQPARDSLITFTQRMYPDYQVAAHHERIAHHLHRAADPSDPLDRLIIVMPPRHGKSVLASEHFPAWYLGNNPDKRIIACSHTAQLAYTFSRRARNKINDPRWPFPDVRIADDLGAVQQWDIAGRRGGYVAAGVGGAITGFGGNCILIDDPVKSAAEAESVTYRETAWEWYQGTLRTRLEPGGSIIVIGTRWHEDDLIGRLIASGDEWTVLHLPALDGDGDALWPDRFDAGALQRIREEVGTRTFEALYQGHPTPAEGGLFKRHWWQRYHQLPPITRAELVVDSAFKEGVENDYSAFALWGDDGQGSAYLIRVWRDRLAFPDLIQLGHDAYAWSRQRFPSLRIPLVVEDKASGQSAVQVWSQPYYTRDGVLPALPVVRYTINGSQSKVSRAEGVTAVVEGGRAFIPQDAPWLDDWTLEHERFPHGKHDDMVDTTSMALTRLTLKRQRGQMQSW